MNPQSAVVAADGTPPFDIGAPALLQNVLETLSSTLEPRLFAYVEKACCSTGPLLTDSFWFVSVAMFDSERTSAAEALRKRLSRSFSVFCYGLPSGTKAKDTFLQYFPYIVSEAIEAGFRAHFASAGHLFTPVFLDRVHAIVCTLFLAPDGGGHGRQLREALRDKLFNPANGRGPPAPPMPTATPTRARVARDWQDIVQDDSGRFAVVGQRGGGQALGGHEVKVATMSSSHGHSRARTASPSVSRRTGKQGHSQNTQHDLSTQVNDENPRGWFFPTADSLGQLSRPSSAEFSVSNCNHRSPLIASYLTPTTAPEGASALLPSRLLSSRLDSAKDQPNFVASVSRASSSLGSGTATPSTRPQSRAAELANALNLGSDVELALGSGQRAIQRYRKQARVRRQVIRETRRAKSQLQRHAEREGQTVLLGGRQTVKQFCFELDERRRRRATLGGALGEDVDTERGKRNAAPTAALTNFVRPTAVQGLTGKDGKSPFTNLGSIAMATDPGLQRAQRKKELALARAEQIEALDIDHMLYDSGRFKTSADAQTIDSAGLAPQRLSLRTLRRSKSHAERIMHVRTVATAGHDSAS